KLPDTIGSELSFSTNQIQQTTLIKPQNDNSMHSTLSTASNGTSRLGSSFSHFQPVQTNSIKHYPNPSAPGWKTSLSLDVETARAKATYERTMIISSR